MLGNRRSEKICFLATLGIINCVQANVDTKLTKNFITDEERTDLLLPRMLVKRLVEVNVEDSVVFSRIELTDTFEVVQVVHAKTQIERSANGIPAKT